jgi:transposase
MLDDGASYRQIMSVLKTTAPTISLWESRYQNERRDRIDNAASQPPQKLTAGLRARIFGQDPRTATRRKYALEPA